MPEVNPLELSGLEHRRWLSAPVVPLSDKEKVRHIVRLQLATEVNSPVWRIVYCWGVSREGEPVQVDLGVTELPRGERGAWSSALIKAFQAQGRYAKAAKVFEPGVIGKVW